MHAVVSRRVRGRRRYPVAVAEAEYCVWLHPRTAEPDNIGLLSLIFRLPASERA